MTGNEIIQVITNTTNPILSIVNGVVGSLLTAIFLRKNTEVQEFEKIKAGKFKQVIDELLESGRMSYTEYYKASNFLNIAEKADAMYAEMKHNGDMQNQYNFDWYMRFYEIVGNISDENVQDMWAKIMAGEINRPNSYSLKTIDILKNIGKQEAELFADVLACSVSTGDKVFLPNYEGYLENCGITYSQIMRLSEMGLIYNDLGIVLGNTVQERMHFINGNKLMTLKAKKENVAKIEIKQFPLTESGKEVATLVQSVLSDDKFIEFAKEVKKENSNVEVQVHEIISVDGANVRYKLESCI